MSLLIVFGQRKRARPMGEGGPVAASPG